MNVKHGSCQSVKNKLPRHVICNITISIYTTHLSSLHQPLIFETVDNLWQSNSGNMRSDSCNSKGGSKCAYHSNTRIGAFLHVANKLTLKNSAYLCFTNQHFTLHSSHQLAKMIQQLAKKSSHPFPGSWYGSSRGWSLAKWMLNWGITWKGATTKLPHTQNLILSETCVGFRHLDIFRWYYNLGAFLGEFHQISKASSALKSETKNTSVLTQDIKKNGGVLLLSLAPDEQLTVIQSSLQIQVQCPWTGFPQHEDRVLTGTSLKKRILDPSPSPKFTVRWRAASELQ